MLLRTLPLLNDDEFEQIVITLFRPGQLATELGGRGVRHINLGGLGRLIPLLRELQPALIISYLFHADMIGRLFVQPRVNMPVMPFLRTTYNFPRYLPARIMERLTKRFARHYLANSQSVKEYYLQQIGVQEQRITVIPNGIDVSVFDKADPAPIIEELQLPKDRFVVTCVANLAKNKGHQYLLEAFERLSSSHKNCWLLLVGSGEEERQLKQQIVSYASKNNILFLGRRRDVPKILAVSDVFVLPTLFEGMSNAIQEAMAAHLPVITTNIPENRIIIEDGKNGLLVPTKDSESLYNALSRVIVDRGFGLNLGSAARTIVVDSFALPAIVKHWRQLFVTWSRAL